MNHLETERLTLRPFEHADADELHALFTDPDVRHFLLDDIVVVRDWVLDEIDESEHRFATSGAGLWAIRVSGDDRIVGFAGLRPFFDPPRLQLLYGLLPTWWSQGFAREAAARVCAHAFEELGFDEIEAATDSPNERSAAVLEWLGFERTRETEEGEAGTVFWRLTQDRL